MGIDHNYNEDFAIARGGNFATGTVWSINVSDRVHIDGSHSYQPHVESGSYVGYATNGKSLIVFDTSSIGATLTNMAYGVDGQVIRIVKPNSSNTLTVRHGQTGTSKQPIYTNSGSDIVYDNYGALSLVCYNDAWYELGS
jgi:hypothetical protein